MNSKHSSPCPISSNLTFSSIVNQNEDRMKLAKQDESKKPFWPAFEKSRKTMKSYSSENLVEVAT